VAFRDVFIRQAHPGPGAPPYHSFDEKMRDARRYHVDQNIPWPVLVDDLEGTVHQVYGGLSNPAYLIDSDGRVAFYDVWAGAPGLHQAIEELLGAEGRGIVRGGVDRMPHIAPTVTNGWPGLRRGLPQSFLDLELTLPGAATSTWIGYQLRPLLAPLTLRHRPMPASVKAMLAAAGIVVLAALTFRPGRRREPATGRGA
jgi:hypothetical protein